MALNRRSFLGLSVGAALGTHLRAQTAPESAPLPAAPLRTPGYNQVSLGPSPALDQQTNAKAILAGFDDDALLKPIREMGNLPAPGRNLGGWYEYDPNYNWHEGNSGFAPAHCFGQWTSAMARFAAVNNDGSFREQALRLQHLLGENITPDFFDKHRFPAYTLDKFNCGLMDARRLLNAPDAFAVADKVRQCALPNLPGRAIERLVPWRHGHGDDPSFTWDEPYTIPENLYILYTLGAGDEYHAMARQYLLDRAYFEPLSRGENVLGRLHAYSHVNALGSAMQAWLVDGSRMHLQAAQNAYEMIAAQSFATGGWGPDETFEKPGTGKVLASLTDTHASFETPCGTYAFLKLSRYLLSVTRDARYGDAMERIIWNAMLGARPLQPEGFSFYYADFSDSAERIYSRNIWPCCAGTYPQVAADFGINTYLLGAPGEGGVWVNLYLPSTLEWQEGNASLRLTQRGGCPDPERVTLHLEASHPTRFALRLRIPSWSQSASLFVNGHPTPMRTANGFTTVDRTWRNGDCLDLHLPATLRLESFPADGGKAPNDLVALGWGPWVLLPLAPQPAVAAGTLLNAERVGPFEWRVRLVSDDLYLRPFFAVGDGTYSTYMRLT